MLVSSAGWASAAVPSPEPDPAWNIGAGGLISINCPKLVLLFATAAMVAVPGFVILPLANGLVAVGRTRTFCQVSAQLWPAPELADEIVKVIAVLVLEVIAAEVPLASLLMFWPDPPAPSWVISTVGAVP